MIDESTEKGAHAASRLRDAIVVWLTTVTPAGQPQASPVWFLWDGTDEVRVYSRDNVPRLRNIVANPHVALNLDTEREGDDVVSMEGEARIVTRTTARADVPAAYVEKYAGKIAEYGWTVDGFFADYPVSVRIRLTRLRTG